MATNSSKVLTIDQLAEDLQVSKSFLYRLAQKGHVPDQKVGKHWRFSKDAIDNWLSSKSLNRGK